MDSCLFFRFIKIFRSLLPKTRTVMKLQDINRTYKSVKVKLTNDIIELSSIVRKSVNNLCTYVSFLVQIRREKETFRQSNSRTTENLPIDNSQHNYKGKPPEGNLTEAQIFTYPPRTKR